MPCGSQVRRHSPSQGVGAGQELKDSLFLLTSQPSSPGQAVPGLLCLMPGSAPPGASTGLPNEDCDYQLLHDSRGNPPPHTRLSPRPSEDTGACLHQGARSRKVRVHQSPQLEKKTQWGFNRSGHRLHRPSFRLLGANICIHKTESQSSGMLTAP